MYAIRCPDGVYVGCSIHVRTRWQSHLHHLRKGRHHCQRLQAAYDRDPSSLVLDRLEEVQNGLRERERHWMGVYAAELLNQSPEEQAKASRTAYLSHVPTEELRAELARRGE